MATTEEFLWTEKYRPHRVADCILPEGLKKTFTDIIAGGEMHNLLLTGTSGLGKTTVGRALCEEMNLDHIVVNGSMEGNIDTLRSKISQFASSVSLEGNRIIEPLHSRCSVIEFNVQKKVLAELCGQFMGRLEGILKKENVRYEPQVLAALIMRFAPDWRRIIGECQRYSVSGVIDNGILVNVGDVNIQTLMKALKEKDFKSMRVWVVNNIDLEPAAIFRKIYDTMVEFAKPSSVPQIVLILADYQYKAAFVADGEINLVACMTELMAQVEWR